MLGGRKTTATLTGETGDGLWPSAVHKGAIYYPIALKPGCRQNGRGTHEWLLYAGVCAVISRKFPITVSKLLQEALSMEQQWCVITVTI
jgi:hypothetical protein